MSHYDILRKQERIFQIKREQLELAHKLASAEADLEEARLRIQEAEAKVNAEIEKHELLRSVDHLKAENATLQRSVVELERQNAELKHRNLSLNRTIAMHQSKQEDYSRTVDSSQLGSPFANT